MGKKHKKRKKGKPEIVSSESIWQKRLPWIIFFSAFLLYANTLTHHYVLDDLPAISHNDIVTRGLENLPDLLTKPLYYGSTGASVDASIYRPVTSISFAMDIEFFGPNPSAAHFINILLYAFTCLSLFFLLKRIFRNHEILPLIITLIFLAHPIHTDVVANIKSRDEILSLLFGLILCLIFLIRYIDTGQRRFFILSTFAYIIGIFSKETTLTYLAVISATLFFISDTKLKRIGRLILPYVAVAIVFYIVRNLCISSLPGEEATITDSVLTASSVNPDLASIGFYYMLQYLRLLLIPYPLVWIYPMGELPHMSLTDPLIIFSIILHTGLWSIVFWGIKRKNIFSYAIFIYFSMISVYFTLTVRAGASMGERFLFSPSLGFSIALGFALTSIFKITRMKDIKRGFLIVMGIILSLYSLITILRNRDWKNQLTISLAAVDVHPQCYRAQSTLAAAYLELANIESDPRRKTELWHKIIDVCNEMLRMNPNDAQIHYNLGRIYFQLSDIEKAEKSFDSYFTLTDAGRQAYLGVADQFLMANQFNTTVRYYKEWLEKHTDDADAFTRLGIIYMDFIKQPKAALPYFQEAVKIDSTHNTAKERISLIVQNH